MYLFNDRKPSAKAHLWDGRDTACRMWSTGGMQTARPGWAVRTTAGARGICHMCQTAGVLPSPAASSPEAPMP